MNKKDDVNENECLNGIVFSALGAKGEKCCYIEIYVKEE